jgi:predicted  nucleic acid-binding Zn-ribbon protein
MVDFWVKYRLSFACHVTLHNFFLSYCLQPIFAIVDALADFADQFTRLESENVQLRKAIKTSADQVLEANRLKAEAQNENTLLKDELKKLKRKMKDEQEARRGASMIADEKEGALRESITNLLSSFPFVLCTVFFQ